MQYSRCTSILPTAARALLAQLDATSKADVETRRNAIRSLSQIARQVDDRGVPLSKRSAKCRRDHADVCEVTVADLHDVFSCCMAAMSDYTTDQRGDVGSWIRKAALCALGEMVAHLATASQISIEDKVSLLPQQTLDRILAGTYKLAVEKLEPVRAAAASALVTMRDAGVHTIRAWQGAEQLKVDLPDG